MPLFLSDRNTAIREQMDDPDCSIDKLYKTYRRFSLVNKAVAGWGRIYQFYLKPKIARLSRPVSLLDIGFGGGDIPVNFATWAADDNLDLAITAIDTDPRAVDYVQQLSVPDTINFVNNSAAELLEQGNQYDIVISNHLLHHLTGEQMRELLYAAQKLSTKQVVFNDIERSDIAYGLFSLLSWPLSYGSFITQDGLASIKRSYTKRELEGKVPGDWQVRRIFPFRLLLIYDHE